MKHTNTKALVKGLGDRFEGFTCTTTNKHRSCKDMRVTKAMVKVVAAAPKLRQLKVLLGSGCKGGTLDSLNGHAELRSLDVTMEGFTHIDLPHKMPALADLKVASMSFSRFDYHCLRHVDCPSLSTVAIDDRQTKENGPCTLDGRPLWALIARYPSVFHKVKFEFINISPLSSFGGADWRNGGGITRFFYTRGIAYDDTTWRSAPGGLQFPEGAPDLYSTPRAAAVLKLANEENEQGFERHVWEGTWGDYYGDYKDFCALCEYKKKKDGAVD